jgi:hypothetical protein
LREIISEMEEGAVQLSAKPFNRRGFLKVSGLASGGLVLAFSLVHQAKAQTGARGEFAPNAFLRI